MTMNLLRRASASASASTSGRLLHQTTRGQSGHSFCRNTYKGSFTGTGLGTGSGSGSASASASASKYGRYRYMSTITRGQDLLEDSLSFGPRRKIILDSYYPNAGIDVVGLHEYMGPPIEGTGNDARDQGGTQNTLLMNGSILAFPHSCYLWKPTIPSDVTLESLSMVQLMDPPIDLLLIGSDESLPQDEFLRIKDGLRKKKRIVVEQMNVMNAMGSFNILNGEDRNVAAAILLNVKNESE